MDTLIATAFAALFAGCWVMEMRCSRKMREGHSEQLKTARAAHSYELEQLQKAQQLYVRQLREEHEAALKSAKCAGWYDGVKYQYDLTKPKRDKAGRFA